MVPEGSHANFTGNILEQTVRTQFSERGFTVIPFSVYNKKRSQYRDQDLLLCHVPYDTIYNHQGYSEFVAISNKLPHGSIRIECKWQQVTGSVDEKYPYLYLNCIEKIVEPHIIIIYGGGGMKPGSIEWLKQTVEQRRYMENANIHNKIIDVFTLEEFIIWMNQNIR